MWCIYMMLIVLVGFMLSLRVKLVSQTSFPTITEIFPPFSLIYYSSWFSQQAMKSIKSSENAKPTSGVSASSEKLPHCAEFCLWRHKPLFVYGLFMLKKDESGLPFLTETLIIVNLYILRADLLQVYRVSKSVKDVCLIDLWLQSHWITF